MSINYTDFVTKYPEFSTLTSDRFNSFLIDATQEISLFDWGVLHDRALELLTAHLIVVSSNKKSDSLLQSLEVNDEGYTVSYGSSQGETAYSASIYGKEYERLKDIRKQTLPITGTLYSSSTRTLTTNPFWSSYW